MNNNGQYYFVGDATSWWLKKVVNNSAIGYTLPKVQEPCTKLNMDMIFSIVCLFLDSIM